MPTVVGGKFLTPDGKKPPEGSDAERAMFKKALQHYKETGENLGKFSTIADANVYSHKLHSRGEMGGKKESKGTVKKPAFLKANPGSTVADWEAIKPQLKTQGYDPKDE